MSSNNITKNSIHTNPLPLIINSVNEGKKLRRLSSIIIPDMLRKCINVKLISMIILFWKSNAVHAIAMVSANYC